MYTLIVTDLYADDRTSATTSYKMEKSTITIGRSRSNEVVVRQTNISSKHASISKSAGGFFLEDLNSTNGTKINKQPVHEPVRIFSDDKIEIGGVIIRVAGHPDLDRGAAGGPARVGDGDLGTGSGEMPNLDDLIPAPPANDTSFPGDAPSNVASDFSLSSIAPLPADGPTSGAPGRESLPYENSAIFKPFAPAADNRNPSLLSANAQRDSEISQDDMEAPPDSLLAKIEKLESKIVKDDRRSAVFSPRDAFNTPGHAFDPFSTNLGSIPSEPAEQSVADPLGPLPGEMAPFPDIDDAPPKAPRSKRSPHLIHVEATKRDQPNEPPVIKAIEKSSITIGRDTECDLCLESNFVSRRHAVIEVRDGSLRVRDLGSANGTFINDQKVRDTARVDSNTEITIGQFRLVCYLGNRREKKTAPLPTQTIDTSIENRGPSLSKSGAIAGPTDNGIAPLPESGDTPGSSVHAVATQLHLARTALGRALDETQFGPHATTTARPVAKTMAQAIRLLYKIQVHGVAPVDLEPLIDTILDKIATALDQIHQAGPLQAAPRDLLAAHAFLYHLSTTGLQYLSENDVTEIRSPLVSAGVQQIGAETGSITKEALFEEKADLAGALIATTKLHADLKYLSCARTLSRSIADLFFIDHMDSLKLVNVVDEACTNVIEHAYDTPKKGDRFHLSFYLLDDSRLAVTVDDRGFPMDTEQAERGRRDGLGLKLMRAFCEEVHFINRGREGKRVLMILPLPSGQAGSPFPLGDDEDTGARREDDSGGFEIELLQPTMAEAISKCIYRAHGYDYYDGIYYRPRDLHNLLSTGKMLIAGAVSQKGAVLGHVSVTFEDGALDTGQLGNPVMIPKMNSASIAGKLTSFVTEKCRQDGLLGLHVQMTASHPYEQMVYANMGAKNTGIMLGYLPPAKRPQNRTEGLGTIRERRTVVTAYLPLGESIQSTVYLPEKYADMLSQIYQETGLERTPAPGGDGRAVRPAISDITLKKRSGLRIAEIRVIKIGDDIIEGIRSTLGEALKNDPVCVYLDLPLSQPAVLEVCPELETFSFIFSGLVPETEHGDMLRVQQIPFDLDFAQIHVENAASKSMLAYIEAEGRRARGRR